MNNIDKIIENIIKAEGGYVNDPDDPGGETNFGITKETARKNGYFDEMSHMPKTFAEKVYKGQYINKPKFNLIMEESLLIAEEVIDTGVNCGQRTASKFLQEVLNVFNNNQQHYKDLKVDGSVGPATISALKAFLAKRGKEGEQVLHFTLNCRQVAYYMSIDNEKFMYGWIKNRAFDQVKGEH